MTCGRAMGVLAARQETRVRLGLARMRRVLARLGEPQEAAPAIHVAGTNGKGSVCAMLDRVLREAGLRVGLYTSPHLHEIGERIRVDGRRTSPRVLGRLIGRVLAAETEPLTYFELLTAAAFLHFRDARVDVAVLETGLGGRLDATNVVRRPLACVVPAIGLDHTDWLGSTLRAVAREKGGIFKRDVPALTAEEKPAALAELRACARRTGARWRPLPRRLGWRLAGTDWARGSQTVSRTGGRRLRIGLLGAAQLRNAALVAETAAALREAGLRVPEGAVLRGLARVRWPGRFELLRRGGKLAILDGAHNPQAMDQFCRTLRASPWADEPKVFVVGMLRDKDYRSMLRRLAPLVEKAVVTRPASPRALDPERLARELRAAAPWAEVRVLPEPAQALESWLGNGMAVACVVGSFYLVGAARAALKGGAA
ncbi:MAG: bifunctional folylpolyglutamate synthase/dihydrofolate synthase [Elusimicrobia bacterium]|nr:bifunctional folylpolyglutamate synthase/dihydrofolate synthase [Elusimicrobiota bacterium]